MRGMRPASSNVGDVHSRQPAVVEVEQGRELDDVREQEREWQMQDELARVKRQRDELQQVRLIGGERDSQTGRQKDRWGAESHQCVSSCDRRKKTAPVQWLFLQSRCACDCFPVSDCIHINSVCVKWRQSRHKVPKQQAQP